MNSVSSKAFDSYPALGVLAVTRAALGCGIGMMVANKFQRSSTRQTTAIALAVPRGARLHALAGAQPWCR